MAQSYLPSDEEKVEKDNYMQVSIIEKKKQKRSMSFS